MPAAREGVSANKAATEDVLDSSDCQTFSQITQPTHGSRLSNHGADIEALGILPMDDSR